jgi:hypothetical protein
MQREQRDLMNLVASLKKPTGRLMAVVMEMIVNNPQDLARASKSSLDAARIVGKYELRGSRLTPDNRPRLRSHPESTVIAVFSSWVFCVTDQPGSGLFIQIVPFQAGDLRLAPGRFNGEFGDVAHRNVGSLVPTAEEIKKLREFRVRGPPVAPFRLPNEAQLPARGPRFLHDSRLDGKSLDALGRLQHTTNPREIVAGSGWPGTRSPAVPNVINKNRGRQLQGVALADSVSFQKLQRRLFGALPVGDVFERLDIPLDKVGQGRGTVGGFNERSGILQVHFPRPSPFLCRRPQLEGLRLSMDDDPILLDPDIGCVPNPGATHTS